MIGERRARKRVSVEVVGRDDLVLVDEAARERRADEPGAAGDEDVYHRMPTSELSPSMKRNALGFTGSR